MPESDPNPFDAFSSDAGAPLRPLPAAEVRRRGDRFRRRRTALIVAGAAAAVIAIAGPLALIDSVSEQTAPPIAETPSPDPLPDASLEPSDPGFVTTIPGDFEIDRGVPAEPRGTVMRQDQGDTGVGGMEFCVFELLDRSQAVDQLAYVGGEPEAARIRDLLVFPTDAEARSAVSSIRAGVEACPEEVFDNTTWTNVVAEVAGDFTLVTREVLVDGVLRSESFWQVIRVNNAVFINERSGEGVSASRAAEEEAGLAPVLEQLCVFSADGCPNVDTRPQNPTDPGTATAQVDDIPAEFPLTAGWPTDFEPGLANGVTGPNDDAEPFTAEFCDGPLPASAAQDRLTAIFQNVEDYRSRTLHSFADADAAVVYVERLTDSTGCGEADLQGTTYSFETRPTDLGGQSFALIRSELVQGQTVRFDVTNVIRLGRAVVVDYLSNDAVDPPDVEIAITERIDAQNASIRAVITAMCRFTEAGC